jgi:hypothetical protein
MSDSRKHPERQIKLHKRRTQHVDSKWPRSLLRQPEAIEMLAGKCNSSSSSRDRVKFNSRTLSAPPQEVSNGSKSRESE